jgi:hypothetical protein
METKQYSELAAFLKPFEAIVDQIPADIRELAHKEFTTGVEKVREGCTRYEVDPLLLDIALAPFTRFLADPEVGVTIHHLIYMKDLMLEYVKIADGIGIKKGTQTTMLTILIYENLNSIGFLEYYETMVRAELDAAETLPRKLMVLNIRKAEIRQAKLRPHVGLYDTREHNKITLKEWLDNEQTKLETHHALLKLEEEELGKGKEKDIRIKTTLTVSQLAFLVRLLVESGYFKEDVKENIYRFFAYYFICSKEKDTTDATFKKLYQNPSLPTQLFVKKILNELARSIS